MIGILLRTGFLCSTILLSPISVFALDQEAGKAFAKSKGCIECHGLSGNTGFEADDGNHIPKLAGQPKAYLVKSMKAYRSGERQNNTMNLIMQVRSDEDIDILAEYYAAQKRY